MSKFLYYGSAAVWALLLRQLVDNIVNHVGVHLRCRQLLLSDVLFHVIHAKLQLKRLQGDVSLQNVRPGSASSAASVKSRSRSRTGQRLGLD